MSLGFRIRCFFSVARCSSLRRVVAVCARFLPSMSSSRCSEAGAKPPLPSSALRKRPRHRTVMDDESFRTALAAVIERDFFPDLSAVRHQAAAISASSSPPTKHNMCLDGPGVGAAQAFSSVDAFHGAHTADSNSAFQERARVEENERRERNEGHYGQIDRGNVTASLPPRPPPSISSPAIIQNSLMFTPPTIEQPPGPPAGKVIQHANTRFQHRQNSSSASQSREIGGMLFPSAFEGDNNEWASESTDITAILGARGKRKALQVGLTSPIGGTKRRTHAPVSAPRSPESFRSADRLPRRKSASGRVESDRASSPILQGIFAAGRSSRSVRSTPGSPASPIAKSSPRTPRRTELRNLSDAAQRLAIRIADSPSAP